ncbi:MAG: triple tyrosine motif-containing protein [Bacteroidota bacterium]
MRNLCAVGAVCFMQILNAQLGDFLLTEHYPQQSNIDHTNFEITSDYLGRICVANRSGVLKYDGEAWDYYKTPSSALSLAVDTQNVVYVGCIGSVGMIDFQEREITYQPIYQSDSLQDLFLETYHDDEKIYFMSTETLVVYQIKTRDVQVYHDYFLNMYKLNSEIYINNADYRTFIVGDSLTEISVERQISFSDDRAQLPSLAVDFNGDLLSHENGYWKVLPQNELISKKGYELEEVRWVNDSLFVCNTVESGLLFFNSKDPKFMEITDYYAGLPDNEIYAMHAGSTSGVWAAHPFGITQISPLFPAYSYSHFPGLNGSITGSMIYENELWVTTSLGLYHLTKDTIFQTKVFYELKSNKKIKSANKKLKETKSEKTESKNDQDSEKKKNFLKRLFRKRMRAEGGSDDTVEGKTRKKRNGLFTSIASVFEKKNEVDKVKGKLDRNTQYTRKTRKIPIDIKNEFIKIEGANGKLLGIVTYQNRLLAVGTSGVYEIKNGVAQIVIEEDISSFTTNDQDQLIISTTYYAVKCFKLVGDVWIEQASRITGDVITGMKSGKNGLLWLAGASQIYKSFVTDSTFRFGENYDLNNAYLDQVSLFEILGKTYFINSEGFYYYDETQNEIAEDKQLIGQLGKPIHHQLDQSGEYIWVYAGKFWHRIDHEKSIIPFEYLGLFPDLRNIFTAPDQKAIWLTTDDNDILKYDPNRAKDLGYFDFFVRKVSNEKGEIDRRKRFTLNYDENFVSIQLSQPDFLGLLNPEFQYNLKGLNNQWSEWTRSKNIDFSFLPEGSYELLVRSRDTFGRENENSVLSFKVKPPYWQTPWFYAIQMVFFGSLVILSARLNQSNSTNRLLRGGLTILTLVLIIEFLQSAISSYFSFKSSPVVEFLLDATIAFMIFPLEKVLRDLMTKGKVKVKRSRKEIQQS